MPAADSPAVIVARYLKANHYTDTLDTFLQEAGLSPDAATTAAGDWTIEKILEEKRQYDASLKYEKRGGKDDKGWTLPAPSKSHLVTTLPSSANVLSIHGVSKSSSKGLYISLADRSLSRLSVSSPHNVLGSARALHNSPILSIANIQGKYVLSTSMSGRVVLSKADATDEILDQRSDHSKYVVQVAITQDGDDSSLNHYIVATAGWDLKIYIYAPYMHSNAEGSEEYKLGDPVGSISFPSNPESMVFARNPDTHQLYLIISRRDSTHLFYYAITVEPAAEGPVDSTSSSPNNHRTTTIKVQEAGKQNLAPHSNAWIAFTPSHLSLCPTDPTLLAVATSTIPNMRLIIVRLLFPAPTSSFPPTTAPPTFDVPETQSSQARAALVIQDREEAAIRLHVSTMAPQTPYSTPQAAWRPDGSGVWVNGDDGVVRGVALVSGKVVATLKAHETGSKVRSLWAGMMPSRSASEGEQDEEEEEWVVSGGFDKKVFVWKILGEGEVADAE